MYKISCTASYTSLQIPEFINEVVMISENKTSPFMQGEYLYKYLRLRIWFSWDEWGFFGSLVLEIVALIFDTRQHPALTLSHNPLYHGSTSQLASSTHNYFGWCHNHLLKQTLSVGYFVVVCFCFCSSWWGTTMANWHSWDHRRRKRVQGWGRASNWFLRPGLTISLGYYRFLYDSQNP